MFCFFSHFLLFFLSEWRFLGQIANVPIIPMLLLVVLGARQVYARMGAIVVACLIALVLPALRLVRLALMDATELATEQKTPTLILPQTQLARPAVLAPTTPLLVRLVPMDAKELAKVKKLLAQGV